MLLYYSLDYGNDGAMIYDYDCDGTKIKSKL